MAETIRKLFIEVIRVIVLMGLRFCLQPGKSSPAGHEGIQLSEFCFASSTHYPVYMKSRSRPCMLLNWSLEKSILYGTHRFTSSKCPMTLKTWQTYPEFSCLIQNDPDGYKARMEPDGDTRRVLTPCRGYAGFPLGLALSLTGISFTFMDKAALTKAFPVQCLN